MFGFHQEEKHLQVVFLNCMSMDLVRDVLGHLLEQLGCKTKATPKNMWSLAVSHVNKSPLPILMILDEVDELLSSSDMENVYKLLEWPHQSSNLLMIGKSSKLCMVSIDRVSAYRYRHCQLVGSH
jgi:Cdc6-like AAA superfamily ATPase